MRLRFIVVLLLASVATPGSAAGSAGLPPLQFASSPEKLATITCSLPHAWLLRIWRGYREDRGPEIQMVPKQPHFVDHIGQLPHAGPWPYMQKVPLLLYGPGYVQPLGSVNRRATSADIAPTLAELLGDDFAAADGKVLDDALVPADERPVPPQLILVVVYDAGGRIVLDEWPKQHPVLDDLITQGAWYDQATVGSSPSSTAPIHPSIGTGAFPRHHGIIGSNLRIGGKLVGAWSQGPRYLIEPTLVDLFDRDRENAPEVGIVATSPWHLGLVGHGSMWDGGDTDVAVLRHHGGGRFWGIPPNSEPFFRFPAYVNGLPPLRTHFRYADASDGTADGTWRGHNISSLDGGFGSPARLPFQTRVIEEVIEREGFGADDVPDVLLTNYKLIDEVGHRWSLNSLEMKDTLGAQDEQLGVLVDLLDQMVGEGKWVLVLTADHGHTPDPDVSGAIRIETGLLKTAITKRFDDSDAVSVVQYMQPVNIFLNTRELEENGHTLAGVARYILGLTAGQVASPDTPISPGEQNSKVFRAAFPSSMLHRLPCLPEARQGSLSP